MKAKPLQWRTRPAQHWPEWAMAWLTLPGSLTLHMQHLHHAQVGQTNMPSSTTSSAPPSMHVQCTRQGTATIPPHWFDGHHTTVRRPQRWVVLHAAGQPRVVALSMLGGPSEHPTAHEWQFWHTLGQQPLGSQLFSIRGLRKGPTHYAAVRSDGGKQTGAFARRTHYLQPPYRTPLWLIEIFLPNLANAPKPTPPKR